MAQARLQDLRPDEPPACNVSWQESRVDRAIRWAQIGQRGATLWFTGLSGSGKSTIGSTVEEHLIRDGRLAYLLDGDNVRHGVCADLGFSHDDRTENARRVSELALLFADAGAVAIVCLISPYESDRRHARELHERAGLDFLEVFVDTSIEECARRDVKGLYAKARDGALSDLTGVGDPYERPTSPDVVLRESLDAPAAAASVLAALSLLGR